MSSKSSGFRVKRSLSFDSKELPYAGKTFYIDVKSCSIKTKVSQRVLNLGGQIENFLSKDLTLLITDKQENANKTDVDSPSQASFKHSKAIPLSRGQALLLKASGHASASVGNNSHGLVQSATKLGVEIQSPSVFLRCSSKLLSKVKAYTQKSKKEDPMCGMSPILWDEDKENMCVIKVEDEEGIFRPLLKHFEKFPQICYSECGSPFDVGVVLTKQNENNQSKKKTVSGRAKLGGYCESCDHWYKCSLREHLNSSKHRKFIAEAENFATLNEVTLSLPDISRFAYRHGLKKGNIHDSNNDVLPSSTYIIDMLSNCDLPVISCKDSTVLQSNEQNKLSENLLGVYKNVSANTENGSDLSKPSIYSRNSQRFSLDDVLKSVTDINCHEKSSDFGNLNSFHTNDVQPPSNLSNASNRSMHENLTTNSCTNHVSTSAHDPKCVLDKENVLTRHGTHTNFIPDANFSSSSYSFGDAGVGNVLSILNKDQESLKSQSFKSSCGPYFSVGKSENKSTVSDSADALDIPVVNIGKDLEGSGNLDVDLTNASGLECIGVLPHCDKDELQEDINVGRSQETTSGLNDELTVTDKKSAAGYQFPEYSNITEESNQSKPSICDKTIPSLDFHCLNFDTDLFGKDMNSVTPSKDHTDALRAKICEKRANTGSTIRNWLIPVDNFECVGSPAGLDATLIDTSVNCTNNEIHDKVEASVKEVPVTVKDIEETNDTSKVAAWIQNNIFDSELGLNAEKCIETNFLKCSEMVEKFDNKTKNIDDIGMDESCSVRKYNSGLSVDQDSNSAWSESGTSISDCTLPNFRANSSKEIASQITNSTNRNSDKNHITGRQENVSIDSDNVSVKSGLSSTVTASGIKISGLSTAKSDASIAISSDMKQVCDKTTNSNTKQGSAVSYSNSALTAYNQNTSHNEKINQNSVSAPKLSKQSVVYENVPVVQNLAQSYRPIVPMPSSQTIHTNEPLKSVAKNSKKKKDTPKGRKTATSRCKRTTNAPMLQNHVTSQNASGAAIPAHDPYNNFKHNQISTGGTSVMNNNQLYSNRSQQPVLNQYGYHLYSPSNAKNVSKSQYPQMQTCVNSAFSQFENGTSMMDFLLSPGSQQPTTGQMHVSQIQHYYAQQGHQGAYVQSHPKNAASSFQQFPLYTHENAPPHFLSRNSNFLTYGSQQPSPKQSVPVNTAPQTMNFPPQPSGFFSPGSSNHASRNLQTIDLSQIAEGNSNDLTSSFNIYRPTQSKTVSKKCLSQSTMKRGSGKNVTDSGTPAPHDNRNSTCLTNMEHSSCMSTSFVTQPKPPNSVDGTNLQGNLSASPYLQGNQWGRSSVQYVPNHSLSPYSSNTVQTLNSIQQGYTHNQGQTSYDKPSAVYNTEQTGAMKLTFRKMPSSHTRQEQSKNDLMHYWNVRKAGDCRLVFSANVLGKRKAEETPTRNSFMNDSMEVNSPNYEPNSKRRRCLIY